jgi:phospholipid-binding lipoprotein MlaA
MVLLMVLLLTLAACAHGGASRDPDVGTKAETGVSEAEPGGEIPAGQGTVESSESAQDEEMAEEEEAEPLFEDEEFWEEEGEDVRIADPIALWNRGMFYFNDKFYFWVAKPVARGYSFIVPEPVRESVANFFANITAPVRVANNILQLKFKRAASEVGRFGVNTTLGIAGLFDVAGDQLGVEMHEEDLGQTLGHYGFGHGIYIVWPLLGPSSLRDTVGFVGDIFLDPVYYIERRRDAIAIRAYGSMNDLSLRIGDYEALKEAAIDPYVALRNVYIQLRKKQVEE